MKDVLINLQMSLIINLKTVYMDGTELDFPILQSTSDDCRVNAGVCLGQLSQRSSDAAKAQAFYPPTSSYSAGSGLVPPLSPSLGNFSSGRSTFSSTAFQAPRTPDAMTEQFGQLHMSPQFYRSTYEERKILDERKISTSSGASQEQRLRPQSATIPQPPAEADTPLLTAGVHRIDETDERSMRRRSSQALAPDDNILLMFPQPGGQPLLTPPSNGQDVDGNSFVSSEQGSQVHSSFGLSRTSTGRQSQTSRDRFGPDDYHDQVARGDGRQFSNSTVYDMYLPRSPERQASTSYSQRAQASNHTPLEHVRYLQDNSRPPRRESRNDTLNVAKRHEREVPRRPFRTQTESQHLAQELQSRPSFKSYPIPVEPTRTPPPRTPPPSGPLPKPPSLPHHSTLAKALMSTYIASDERPPSLHTLASTVPSISASIIPAHAGPLTLPTDKNLLGFCKGAFRLQAGLERKAFTVANRPLGFSGMSSYWRCEKCNFEGPVVQIVNTGNDKKKKGKPEKVFDPKVRVSEEGGVRYRWAFLAKCHVCLKGMVSLDTPKDGSFGSFGCIFCCAEGKNRGWLDTSISNTTSMVTSSNTSVKSGRTANSGAKIDGGAAQTPIFGNVSSFMAHLESVHRPQPGWPNAEMVGRMRVVVGRVAGAEEGWDVNLVPD